jgi:hypothetical protein
VCDEERRSIAGIVTQHPDLARWAAHLVVRAVPASVPVLPHPGDHFLDVDQVVEEPRFGAEAVVGADRHPALARQTEQERPAPDALAAAVVTPAMEVDEHWRVLRLRPMVVHVEEVKRPAGPYEMLRTRVTLRGLRTNGMNRIRPRGGHDESGGGVGRSRFRVESGYLRMGKRCTTERFSHTRPRPHVRPAP